MSPMKERPGMYETPDWLPGFLSGCLAKLFVEVIAAIVIVLLFTGIL